LEAEVHPVDMLVDLVISEELDPWDIDIGDIAKRFLERVKRMHRINLRLSGKTLLASSILLRMKSESIVPREDEEEEEEESWDEGHDELEERAEVPPISTPVRRRAGRKTTLFELIEALQRALSEEIIRKNFPREGRPRPKLVIQVDEEGIKEKMAKVFEKVQKLTDIAEVIKFSDLIAERREIVEVLLALLYLDSQRKITIWQKELFGEIFITINT
jgi:segregation and condensation protein A